MLKISRCLFIHAGGRNSYKLLACYGLLLIGALSVRPVCAQEEEALQDSLEQAETALERAYWLKEKAWYYKAARPARAHELAGESLALARQLSNSKAIADALHTDGMVYWYEGKVPQASEAFFAALKIREAINDSVGLARSYNNIGNVYLWQGDAPRAQSFYEQALEIRQRMGNETEVAYSLVSLAEAREQQEDLSGAIWYTGEALDRAVLQRDSSTMAFCYDYLGRFLSQKGDFAKAREYLNQAISINSRAKSSNKLIDNWLALARIDQKMGSHGAAIAWQKQALKLSRETGALGLAAQSLEALGQSYAELGVYDSAYHYSLAYNQAYIELVNVENERILLDVQEQYNSQQQEAALLAVQRREARRLAGVLIIALVLFLGVAVLAFVQYRRQRKANHLLEEKAREIARINQEVADQNKDLKESNFALEQFAYVASHDLREPLRTIGSFTSLLARRFPEGLDSQSQEFIQYILGGTEHMSRLLDGLMDYARLSNIQVLKRSEIDMNELLARVKASLQADIQEKNAAVVIDSLPVFAGHEVMLAQLFQNLISNGLKFNDKEQPAVRVTGCLEGGQAIFTVQDNGIGIDEAYFNKIFHIFQRLDKRNYSGTGLGLAICQRIVARHRGHISVSSSLGNGTAFTIALPIQT
ncbi:ATP-binding protein [Phaeodactylibacter luteus]|uniref:histidine kinase n=1 Tax=Phaeodactylibacter luteus TaxID=1564516 RepID=A0A5C6S003_9BACT|nr:ATP-binding protein [Phaeodactylibacter luteus]TXB67575.1 tetratricopeptide repeat protein [Phaeodactylibacter luteus]